MSAPLIAGNDLRTMDASTRAILTNPEVIAVDQDPNAFQAIKVHDNGAGQEVWSKPLASSGDRAGLGSAAGSRELHRQLQRERTRAWIGAAPNPRDRSIGGRRIPQRPALDLHGE